MYIDPLYIIIVGPGFLLAMYASWKTKSTFDKYSRVSCASGVTGAEAAQIMLERNGVYNCRIEPVDGYLTDHYDPRSRTLRLSSKVYSSRSLSAIGVACHEAGHALQHAAEYSFLSFRSNLVPLVGFSRNLGYIFFIIGLLLQSQQPILGKNLALIGCIIFAISVLFTIVTLPVEWDASARAKKAMVTAGLVSQAESKHAGKVLNAAFLTYLAGAITAVLTLLYYLYRSGLLNNRRS